MCEVVCFVAVGLEQTNRIVLCALNTDCLLHLVLRPLSSDSSECSLDSVWQISVKLLDRCSEANPSSISCLDFLLRLFGHLFNILWYLLDLLLLACRNNSAFMQLRFGLHFILLSVQLHEKLKCDGLFSWSGFYQLLFMSIQHLRMDFIEKVRYQQSNMKSTPNYPVQFVSLTCRPL